MHTSLHPRTAPFTAPGQVASRRGRALRAPAVALFGLRMPGAGTDQRSALKAELLEAIRPLKRGLLASEEDKARVDALARRLERKNTEKKPLASPNLNGQWELLYTTSDSILGTNKPAFLRPSGPIYQVIDATTLRARNKETAPLFNQVSAELIPESASRVKVRFLEFKLLGLIPVRAPPSAAGELDVTYLDEDLRISRGNRGNLFVLRMQDRGVRP